MTWSILAVLAWLLWAAFCRVVRKGNPRPDDAGIGALYRFIQVYARLVHGVWRARFERASLPAQGPVIIVCNHTAGIDPILVQSVLSREIRWMMARDMMLPAFSPLWEWLGIIGVEIKEKRDTASVREALRHLAAGGVLGIFPEGGIERPARRLRPFMPGLGLIVAKSRAPVLPVFITDTPVRDRAWQSLWAPSSSTLRFGPLMTFGADSGPIEITHEVEAWFLATSGWPRNTQREASISSEPAASAPSSVTSPS